MVKNKKRMSQHLPPHTPILIGVAVSHDHTQDPRLAPDRSALVCSAATSAMRDAGCATGRIDEIIITQGLSPDPDSIVALKTQLQARNARTVLMEIGILQQSAFSRAAQSIAAGQNNMVLIAGGEAQYRQRQADKMNIELPKHNSTANGLAEPDEMISPDGELVTPIEAERGLLFPVTSYAVIENTFCHARGLGLKERNREIDTLWSAMSKVAATNPDAWQQDQLSADKVRSQVDMSAPYTRAHVSQWNVNQAAALIMCSVQTAQELDIDPKRWIFAISSCESNHMQSLSERAQLNRCLGVEYAAPKALEVAGLKAADINFWDLYSCFPIAVRLQQEALALPSQITPTVTGGMSFAGGPLNNYSLQSTVKMVQLLRQKGGYGVVSSVSGILHKYGIGVWSSTPPVDGNYQHADTPRNQVIAKDSKTTVPTHDGEARIAGATLAFERGQPKQLIAIVDIPKTHTRTIATSNSAHVMAQAQAQDITHRTVRIEKDKLFFKD